VSEPFQKSWEIPFESLRIDYSLVRLFESSAPLRPAEYRSALAGILGDCSFIVGSLYFGNQNTADKNRG